MTANELATLLEDDVEWTVALNSSLPERLIKAAKMLRQQEENIQEYKKTITWFQKERDALIKRGLEGNK
jgi:hypothetical protein